MWMRLCWLALLAPMQLAAAEPDPRVVAEIESALVRLYESGALSEQGGPIELVREPRTRYELGAVVDMASESGGLPVVAVTPGGAAERVGLQVGDRLLQLNAVPLAAGGDPVGRFMHAMEQGEGRLELQVARGGRVVQLSGQADATEVPGFQLQVTPPQRGCGRIDQSLRPPVPQDIFPVVLHEIDGRLPGALDATTFRVKPGPHVLKLSEAIDSHYFTGNQNRKRSNLFRHERFKEFVLDVAPNTTYRLGARFIRDNAEDIRGGSYWEPVVWAQATVPCR